MLHHREPDPERGKILPQPRLPGPHFVAQPDRPGPPRDEGRGDAVPGVARRRPAGMMAPCAGMPPRQPQASFTHPQGTNPNMDEPTPSAPPAPPAPVKTGLRIDRIYLRDMSFESPQAPDVFASEWKPQFQIELNTRANRLDDGRFEVILMVNLEAKSDENALFMVEVQQAGIFHIEATDEEDLREALGVACPEALFPYAREAVDTLLVKGTFPPFLLAPVNFDSLYAEAKKRREAAQAAG